MNLAAIETLLTDPATFFEQRGSKPGLKGPFTVVAAIALVSMIASAMTVLQFTSALSSDVQTFALIGAVFGAAIAAVGPFITWLIYTVAFLVITAFFDSDGEFRDLFALTGWGFLPRVLAAVVSVVVTAIAVQSIPAPSDPAGFQTFSQQLQSAPILQVSTVVSIVATLWSAYIWVPAVERARNVSHGQAMIAVGIPVAIGILLSGVGLVSNAL